MNDLYYIEYKPELMLSDSLDMDPETELAHRRLCDFIWRMDKAPKADNEFLKQFTKTRATEWGRVKKGLLEKGWTEVAGFFLHHGAIESLNFAKEKYAAQCNQTAAATAKRNGSDIKLTVCQRDSVTGIVTLCVTTPVTTSVTPAVTTPQPEPEQKPVKTEREGSAADEKKNADEPRQHPPYAEIPTWEEVKQMADRNAIPEKVARRFFDHYDSKNLWLNKHNRMINVLPSLLIWANNERQGRSPIAANGKSGEAAARPAFVSELKTVLEAKKALRQAIRNRGIEDAMGWRAKNQDDATAYRQLNIEIGELMNRIAGTPV